LPCEWRGNGRLWMEEDFILQSRLGNYEGKNWARQKSYGRDVTFWWCLIVCCLLWRYGADEQCKCILKHHKVNQIISGPVIALPSFEIFFQNKYQI
jgi:hypothetical protein